MTVISGATRVLPIIGRPIAQVKAPEAFNPFFQKQGIDAVCVPFSLEDAAADAFIEAMRGCHDAPGFIATIPHKQRAAAAAGTRSDRADFLGAANLVRREADGRLVADMTDGLGCVAAMRAHGVEPASKIAFVVGVGGAGSAIAYALADAGVERLYLTDLDGARANDLAKRLAAAFPAVTISTEAPDFAEVNIAVNASPVGMNGDPNMPYSLDGMAAGGLVADVVTAPEETPWLKAAKARGCIVQTGREMVAGQFDLMAKHFRFL